MERILSWLRPLPQEHVQTNVDRSEWRPLVTLYRKKLISHSGSIRCFFTLHDTRIVMTPLMARRHPDQVEWSAEYYLFQTASCWLTYTDCIYFSFLKWDYVPQFPICGVRKKAAADGRMQMNACELFSISEISCFSLNIYQRAIE